MSIFSSTTARNVASAISPATQGISTLFYNSIEILHDSCFYLELYDLMGRIDWKFIEPNLLQRRHTSKGIILTEHLENVALDIIFCSAVTVTEHRERLMAEFWMRNRHYSCLAVDTVLEEVPIFTQGYLILTCALVYFSIQLSSTAGMMETPPRLITSLLRPRMNIKPSSSIMP